MIKIPKPKLIAAILTRTKKWLLIVFVFCSKYLTGQSAETISKISNVIDGYVIHNVSNLDSLLRYQRNIQSNSPILYLDSIAELTQGTTFYVQSIVVGTDYRANFYVSLLNKEAVLLSFGKVNHQFINIKKVFWMLRRENKVFSKYSNYTFWNMIRRILFPNKSEWVTYTMSYATSREEGFNIPVGILAYNDRKEMIGLNRSKSPIKRNGLSANKGELLNFFLRCDQNYEVTLGVYPSWKIDVLGQSCNKVKR